SFRSRFWFPSGSHRAHHWYHGRALERLWRDRRERGESVPRGGRHRQPEDNALRTVRVRSDLNPDVMTIVVNAEHVHHPAIGTVFDALQLERGGEAFGAIGLATRFVGG